MDEDSAFTDDFDMLPDIVKSKLVFKPVNPGPFKLVKSVGSMSIFALTKSSPTNKTSKNVNGNNTRNTTLNRTIQTPSQILRNASIISVLNKFDMPNRFSVNKKDKEKELDELDNTSGDDEKVNLAPSEVVFNEPNFNGSKSGICGIFRGIGPDGKRIAIWSVSRFQKILKSKIKLIDKKQLSIGKALKNTFYELHEAIALEEKIDNNNKNKRGSWINVNKKKNKEDEKESMFQYKNSGITATVVWLFKTKIICANVGDSTCIVGSEIISEEAGVESHETTAPNISAHFLTEKHDTVDNKIEIDRVKRHGGAEFREQGVTYGIGTERICFPGQNFPGLLITRIIGFHDGIQLGLIPEPSIYEMEYGERKKSNNNNREDDEDNDTRNVQTLIIATPGLWDVMGPYEVIEEILLKCRDRNDHNPAQHLLSKAYRRRSAKDISCIVLKFGWGDNIMPT
jgi:serine/threonine protein phosphatase PrpC